MTRLQRGHLSGALTLAGTLGLGLWLAGAPKAATVAPAAPVASAPALVDEGVKLATNADAQIHEVALSDGTVCVAIVGKNAVALTCNWTASPATVAAH